MEKEEIIARYCEGAYEKMLAQSRARYKTHKEEAKAATKKHREEHPEKSRKGGKYYDKILEDNRTGLRGKRTRIRVNHANQYRPYKMIIAPESQIHHEWIPETAEYRGVALVEADAHRYGIIDVIQILDGKITLLTEEEIKRGKGCK